MNTDAVLDWLKKLFTEPPSSFLQLLLLYIGAAIGIIHAFIRVRHAMLRKIWPPRPGHREWFAQCNPTPPTSIVYNQPDADPNNAWRNDRGRWTHGKKMGQGDWYHLFMSKPRVLSRIYARSEGERFPVKTKLLIKETRDQEDWEAIADIDGELKYQFLHPRKVEAIKFEIIEPRLKPIGVDGNPPAWAIYHIDLWEKKLFGRWLEKKIE